MKTLVSHLAGALIDTPESMMIEEKQDNDSITIELRVASDDIGKVIGKQGRTARAIRTLLSAVAERDDKKVRLDIIE
jgi:predicted RNA-binding protein YlqC (UPF0109 family)